MEGEGHDPPGLPSGYAPVTLLTLNKQTLPLWISKDHLSVLFYVTSSLVRKSVLIKWRWDTVISCDAWSIISLKPVWRLASLSVTLGFSLQTKNKVFPITLRFLPKKDIEQSNVQTCTHKALSWYVYNIMFFWCLFTFLKCFY